MFHVRPAVPEDLPAVSRLAAELVRMHHRFDPQRFFLVEPVERGYERFFRGELRSDGAFIVVAEWSDGASRPELESGIAGYAYATLEPRNWNDLLDACGKLNDVYVHPAARRHGVARALIADVMARLTAAGAPRVVLMSAWPNTDAQATFERMGFRRTMVEMTAELASAPPDRRG